jgi:hypothetical protein
MNKIPIYTLMLLLPATMPLTGCDKSSTNCFSSTGETIRQERTVAPFDSISMYNNVNVILTQGSSTGVIVEAGENIIDGISTEVIDRNLVIQNLNICNWTRSFNKPVNVYVNVGYLWKVYYNSSGNLTSTNTLEQDSLKIDVWGGCGTIDLDMHVSTGYFSENLGTADFRLSGVCAICYIWSGEYGPFDCDSLSTGYCFVTTQSSNDCRVRVEKTLGATISSIGNIYYTGDPDSVYYTITGQGKLIRY